MNSLTTEASPWPSRPPSYRFRLSRAASLAENGSDNTENGPDETSSIRLPEPAHLEPTARRDSVDSFMPERPGQPPTYDLLAQHRRPPENAEAPEYDEMDGFHLSGETRDAFVARRNRRRRRDTRSTPAPEEAHSGSNSSMWAMVAFVFSGIAGITSGLMKGNKNQPLPIPAYVAGGASTVTGLMGIGFALKAWKAHRNKQRSPILPVSANRPPFPPPVSASEIEDSDERLVQQLTAPRRALSAPIPLQPLDRERARVHRSATH